MWWRCSILSSRWWYQAKVAQPDCVEFTNCINLIICALNAGGGWLIWRSDASWFLTYHGYFADKAIPLNKAFARRDRAPQQENTRCSLSACSVRFYISPPGEIISLTNITMEPSQESPLRVLVIVSDKSEHWEKAWRASEDILSITLRIMKDRQLLSYSATRATLNLRRGC